MIVAYSEDIVGKTVFYQKPHMRSPEYGTITAVISPSLVQVRFLFDDWSKPCNPDDLYWPPNFCARDGGVPGQQYSES